MAHSSAHERAQAQIAVVRAPNTVVDTLETHYRSGHTERLILRELTHGVSTELAAVTALIAAARTRPGGTLEIFGACPGALEGFASVQRLLYVPDVITCVDGCTYVRQLCRVITRAKISAIHVQNFSSDVQFA